MATPFHEARIKALLTVADMADRTGLSVRTVYRAEQGDSISEIAQERLAQALGFDGRRDLFPESESEEASA